MSQTDVVAQWKAFTPEQRDMALKRMTFAQKIGLKRLIEKAASVQLTDTPPVGWRDRILAHTGPLTEGAENASNAAECIGAELGNDAYWKFGEQIFEG